MQQEISIEVGSTLEIKQRLILSEISSLRSKIQEVQRRSQKYKFKQESLTIGKSGMHDNSWDLEERLEIAQLEKQLREVFIRHGLRSEDMEDSICTHNIDARNPAWNNAEQKAIAEFYQETIVPAIRVVKGTKKFSEEELEILDIDPSVLERCDVRSVGIISSPMNLLAIAANDAKTQHSEILNGISLSEDTIFLCANGIFFNTPDGKPILIVDTPDSIIANNIQRDLETGDCFIEVHDSNGSVLSTPHLFVSSSFGDISPAIRHDLYEQEFINNITQNRLR